MRRSSPYRLLQQVSDKRVRTKPPARRTLRVRQGRDGCLTAEIKFGSQGGHPYDFGQKHIQTHHPRRSFRNFRYKFRNDASRNGILFYAL
jgi:hypothetical protein